MADPHHHAVSAARTWGGTPDQYMEIEKWFDESKALLADFRHRALRHHTEGIELACRIFGQTLAVKIGLVCDVCGATVGYRGRPEREITDERVEHNAHCLAHDNSCVRDLTRDVPVRWIAERHVREDLGRIPSAVDWLRAIKPESWMNRPRRLSRELETDHNREESDAVRP